MVGHAPAEIVWTWNQGPAAMKTPPLNHSGPQYSYGAQLYGREVVVIIWAGGFWSDVDRDPSDRQSLKYSAKQRERAR